MKKIIVKIVVVLLALAMSAFVGLIVPTLNAQVTGNVEIDREKFIASFKEELKNAFIAQEEEIAIAQKIDDIKVQIDKKKVETGDIIYVNNKTNEVLEQEEMNTLRQEYVDKPETEPVMITQIIVNDKDTIDLTEMEQIPLGDVEKLDTTMASSWLESKIEENRDNIDDTDLAVGLEIYNSLDVEYLFAIAEDGLTEDEKVEVKSYLKQHLSEEQMKTAETLYYKYVELIK